MGNANISRTTYAANTCNAAGAISALIELGETVKSISRQTGVHLATIYRWRKGVQPRERGRLALRELVFSIQRQVTGARKLDRTKDLLCRKAVAALMTNAERAKEAKLIDRINATPPAPVAPPVRSVTTRVDPFELARDKQIEIPF